MKNKYNFKPNSDIKNMFYIRNSSIIKADRRVKRKPS